MEGLEFEIGFHPILPKKSHRLAMNNYRAPANGRELLSFLGVVHFSRNMECAVDRMTPLHDLSLKNAYLRVARKMGKNTKRGLQRFEIRTLVLATIASPTFLVSYERGERKMLITDFSGVKYGAALLQEQTLMGLTLDEFSPWCSSQGS